jgi:hypothetical protein
VRGDFLSPTKFEINKTKLIEIFEKLNEMLKDNSITVDLYIYGGSYMTLVSDTRPETNDIDCIFNTTNDEIFNKILETIKSDYKLEKNWFSQEVTTPIEHLKTQDLNEFKRFSNLNIFIPSIEQMLAMKILSSRAEPSKDFIDAYILCRKLNITTKKELLDIVAKYIDLSYLGKRQITFIKYLGEDLGYDWE